MKKVTGIGGIFFKCKDPNKMKEWYKTHLGIDAGQYGASFEWYEDADGKKKGLTQWNLNSETAKLLCRYSGYLRRGLHCAKPVTALLEKLSSRAATDLHKDIWIDKE